MSKIHQLGGAGRDVDKALNTIFIQFNFFLYRVLNLKTLALLKN